MVTCLSVIKMLLAKSVRRLRAGSIGPQTPFNYKIGLMVTLARPVIGYARASFVPRHKLALQAAALRPAARCLQAEAAPS